MFALDLFDFKIFPIDLDCRNDRFAFIGIESKPAELCRLCRLIWLFTRDDLAND